MIFVTSASTSFAWLFLLTVMISGATFLISLGSRWAPAATAATATTTSRMVSSYVVQTLVFEVPPDALTIIGALFMLSSVLLATTAAWMSEVSVEQPVDIVIENEDADDDDDSIASFIATECVSFKASELSVR